MPFTKDPAPIVRSTSRPTIINFYRDDSNAVVVHIAFMDLAVHHTMPLAASSLSGADKTTLGTLIDQLGADALAALGFTAS